MATRRRTSARRASQRDERGFRLYDYDARYYSPGLGRFVSPDTVVPEPTSSGGFNRYAYVYNNPIRYYDSDGHCFPFCFPGVMLVGAGALTNIINMVTDNTQEASVLSVGVVGGARIRGIGPVVHGTYDLVSNESGQIQLFYTEADGYYIDGLLLGDEAAIDASEIFLDENASRVPQADSYSFPQINFSVTKGNVNGGKETGERVGENVNRYGGKSVIFSGGVGLAPLDLIGLEGAYSIGLSEDGKSRSGVTTGEGGAGLGGGTPATAAYYLAESHPVLEEPIRLPRPLIPVCQAVGQCGN